MEEEGRVQRHPWCSADVETYRLLWQFVPRNFIDTTFLLKMAHETRPIDRSQELSSTRKLKFLSSEANEKDRWNSISPISPLACPPPSLALGSLIDEIRNAKKCKRFFFFFFSFFVDGITQATLQSIRVMG